MLGSWSNRRNTIFIDISKSLELRASFLSHPHWLIWLSIIPNHLWENFTCLRIHSFFFLCYTPKKKQTTKKIKNEQTKNICSRQRKLRISLHQHSDHWAFVSKSHSIFFHMRISAIHFLKFLAEMSSKTNFLDDHWQYF